MTTRDVLLRADLHRIEYVLTAHRAAGVVNEQANRIAKGAQDDVAQSTKLYIQAIGEQVEAMIRQMKRLETEVHLGLAGSPPATQAADRDRSTQPWWRWMRSAKTAQRT